MPTNKALLNKKAKCYGRRGKAEKIRLTMNDMVVEVGGEEGPQQPRQAKSGWSFGM
jgi:hypothetical protein